MSLECQIGVVAFAFYTLPGSDFPDFWEVVLNRLYLNKWYVKVTYEREARIGILNFEKLYLINVYACIIYKPKNKGFHKPWRSYASNK